MQVPMMRSTLAAVGGDDEAAAATRGKRKADESTLNDSERFAKRFNLLNLDGRAIGSNSNYYIPVASSTHHAGGEAPPSAAAATTQQPPQRRSNPVAHHEQNDGMQIDDTRDRVFIYNLDAELAEIEDDPQEEDRLIFLPDIERRFSRIPQQVLTGRGRHRSSSDADEDEHEQNKGHQELVLYNVPQSLTGDERHDSVRKAILETRHRARERALEEARQLDMNRMYDRSASGVSDTADVETAHGYSSGYEMPVEEMDEDAMDMD